MGWGVLAEVPGREIVVGAVTKPWEPNVVFRALPPEQFASFNEPGFVKIAWTLRADPVDAGSSVFRTETRTMTTDRVARAKFRRYWSFVSPGVVLIRRLSLLPLKREAERRALAGARVPILVAKIRRSTRRFEAELRYMPPLSNGAPILQHVGYPFPHGTLRSGA